MLEEEEASFDFLQLWTLFKSHWKWFPISIVLCLLIAGVYLFFTAPTVTVTGKMEIIDKSKKGGGGLSAGLAMLNNLPLGLGSSLGGAAGAGSIESEKEMILSTTLVRNVVKDLKLHTEYRLSKWGRKTLLYQNNPVEVTLDEAHLAWLDTELPLTFHQINLTITKDTSGYTVETMLKENKEKTDLPAQTFATLPATLKTDAGTLTLTENKLPAKQAKAYEGSYTLKVTITPPSEVANDFIDRFTAEPPSKKVMNMLSLSLTDENLMRGIDFINHLVEAYNNRANDEKNEEARKTDEFVNARLAKIDAELGSSDAAWESTKKDFQITTPEVDAEEVMTKKSLYETQLVEIGTQLQLHDYLSEFVNDPANLFEFVPLSLGASGGDKKEGAVGTQNASLIQQHNNMVNQRKDLLKSMSEMAPQVQRLTESIRELQPNIKTAMKRDRESILMKKSAVEREYGKYMGRVGTAPKMERVLTEIGRQREIKQGVYLLMLQKREETAMELANTTDKGKLVDETTLVKNSSKPQKKMVLLVALFLGALLPAGILYLLQMFKQTIDTRAELESLTRLPIIGEIPSTNSDDALRTLRTNLLLNLKAPQKTILVTSATPAAGKTFLAQHLATTLTAIGKKALYLDCDLRKTCSSVTMSKENPSVSSVLMSEKSPSSAPLSKDNSSVSSVTMSEKSVSSVLMSKDNSSLQSSHPADILASADFAQQLKAAQASNDYVILDSPALGEYTDAYQLASFADATLYIVHSGKTPKSAIESLTKAPQFPNVMFALNTTK